MKASTTDSLKLASASLICRRNRCVLLLCAAVATMVTPLQAGSVTASAYGLEILLPFSRPVVDSAGTRLAAHGGFVAVGTFPSLEEEELRRLGRSGSIIELLDDFEFFGNPFRFGELDGFYVKNVNAPLPPAFLDKPVYTLVANGASPAPGDLPAASTEWLIVVHSARFTADPFFVNAFLTEIGPDDVIFGQVGPVVEAWANLTQIDRIRRFKDYAPSPTCAGPREDCFPKKSTDFL